MSKVKSTFYVDHNDHNHDDMVETSKTVVSGANNTNAAAITKSKKDKLEKRNIHTALKSDARESAALTSIDTLTPSLLAGELVGNKCNVLRFHAYANNRGDFGKLYCTNYKISFIPATAINEDESTLEYVRNKLIGRDDVALANIAAIYQVSGDKLKKLSPSKIPSSSKELRIQIRTKDFAVLNFEFQAKNKSDGKSLITAILAHSFEKNMELLFAHRFANYFLPTDDSLSVQSEDSHFDCHNWVPKNYSEKSHWEVELRRLGAFADWKIVDFNESYRISPSMSRYFPVPSKVSGKELCEAASQYFDNRLPMWCYSHDNGFYLMTMSTVIPESDHVSVDQKLLESIKASQYVDVIAMNSELPSVLDIREAYRKLSNICAPHTAKGFYDSDNTVYSQLENCRWLEYVGSCLRVAKLAAGRVAHKESNIILNESSMDLTCIVSSLIQLMLDPFTRTIEGFQNLTQRCWISAGHRFRERIGLLGASKSEKEETPVFLLFLDCVYQLIVQFPDAFEFTDIYLISLWDSTHLGLFQEFIFNCDHERSLMCKSYEKETNNRRPTRNGGMVYSDQIYPSVWQWDLQFTKDYDSLFHNPLFDHFDKESSTKQELKKLLFPNTHASQIEVWISCYYRHTAPLQIQGGGRPAEYLQQCVLTEEIMALKGQIASMKSDSLSRRSVVYFNAYQEGDKAQKDMLKSTFVTSTFPYNNTMSRNVSDISLFTLLQPSAVLSATAASEDDP